MKANVNLDELQEAIDILDTQVRQIEIQCRNLDEVIVKLDSAWISADTEQLAGCVRKTKNELAKFSGNLRSVTSGLERTHELIKLTDKVTHL